VIRRGGFDELGTGRSTLVFKGRIRLGMVVGGRSRCLGLPGRCLCPDTYCDVLGWAGLLDELLTVDVLFSGVIKRLAGWLAGWLPGEISVGFATPDEKEASVCFLRSALCALRSAFCEGREGRGKVLPEGGKGEVCPATTLNKHLGGFLADGRMGGRTPVEKGGERTGWYHPSIGSPETD